MPARNNNTLHTGKCAPHKDAAATKTASTEITLLRVQHKTVHCAAVFAVSHLKCQTTVAFRQN